MKACFSKGSEISGLKLAGGLASPEILSGPGEGADMRVWVEDAGEVLAHAAVWWNGTPPYEAMKLGTVGALVATDGGAAALLLEAACGHLKNEGCQIAIGPMNRNTWLKHRHVIFSDGRGRFLLEPRNYGFDPDWWAAAGFGKLADYTSSLVKLDGEPSVSPRLEERLARSGVVIRTIDLDNYEEELRNIHAVCLKSFSGNFLYTPLEFVSFLEAYNKVREHVRPELVRVAEREGVVCGFVFAIPDLEAAGRGEKPALIVKTLAVDPGSRCAGLGSLLVDQVHEAGIRLGFGEAIHALQYEDNSSRKITGRHHGDVFRRYALFSKIL